MKNEIEYYKTMKQLKEEETMAKELWSVLDEIAKENGWYSWFPDVNKSMVVRYARSKNLISKEEYRILSEYVR